MTCVAITRGGFGTAWVFKTRTAAFLHPIVQYGDALLCGPGDMVAQYNTIEWNNLRYLLGLPPALMTGLPPRGVRELKAAQAPGMWDALLRLAVGPPSDLQRICDIVAKDRSMGPTMAKKKEGAPADAVANEATGLTNEAKTSNLPTPVRGPKGTPQDAVITLGTDAQGNKYGPDNNPKKPGSKTHGRFASYYDGMTIAQALEAGLTTADLVYDRDKGFVSFSGGTIAAVPAAAPAAEGTPAEETVPTDEEASAAEEPAAA